MIVELSDTEVGLLERALRQNLVRYWGEAQAARELISLDANGALVISRMYIERAERARVLVTKLAGAAVPGLVPTAFELTADDLSFLKVGLRDLIVGQLGESALYLVDRYYGPGDVEFRRVMSEYESGVASRLFDLSLKLRSAGVVAPPDPSH